MPNLMMSKCKVLLCNSKNKNPATLKNNRKIEKIMEHSQKAGQVIRIIQTMGLYTIKLKNPITFSLE